MRLSMNPRVVRFSPPTAIIADCLARLLAHPRHTYLKSTPQLLDGEFANIVNHLTGYRQVTDATLLHVAHANGASFATFDSGVAQLAPAGLHVELLQP